MGRRAMGWGLVVVMVVIGIIVLTAPAARVDAQNCAGAGSNFGACVGATAAAAGAPVTLYKRLGGREGIALVVNDFVATMVADDRVKARFKDMKGPDVEKLKSNLADQICDATGGPCSYLGRDMKATHKGMQITEAEWNATVENLGKALDKNNVGAKEKQELVGALAPMKGDIVGQ